MEEWINVKVSDIANINAKTISKNYAFDKIQYLDVSSTDQGRILGYQNFNLREAPSRAKRILSNNDIVISSVRPNLKHYAFINNPDQNAVASTGYVVISAKNNICDPRFLYYTLTTQNFTDFLTRVAEGHTSTYPSFNPDIIENAIIRIPKSIDLQKKISVFLGTIDDKIDLNNQMNETLESMAKAIFKEWFIDFGPVRAKAEGRRPFGMDDETAALFPDSFEDSELGPIPKGWKEFSAGELFDVIKGASYRSDELQESRTALVTLKSFKRGGGYRLDGLKPYIGQYKSEQEVSPGEIVLSFTDVTQTADIIGRPAIVIEDKRFDRLIASLDVGIVRKKSDKISNEFIYFLLDDLNFTTHAKSFTSGTTVLHLSKEVVKKFKFILPPLSLIKIFSQNINLILEQKRINIQENISLEEIKNLLLPKLISGEISLSNKEKEISPTSNETTTHIPVQQKIYAYAKNEEKLNV